MVRENGSAARARQGSTLTPGGYQDLFYRQWAIFLFTISVRLPLLPLHPISTIFNNNIIIDHQPTILTHRSSSLHRWTRHVCILTAIMYIFSILNQNSFPTLSVSQVFPTSSSSSSSYCPFFLYHNHLPTSDAPPLLNPSGLSFGGTPNGSDVYLDAGRLKRADSTLLLPNGGSGTNDWHTFLASREMLCRNYHEL